MNIFLAEAYEIVPENRQRGTNELLVVKEPANLVNDREWGGRVGVFGMNGAHR